MSNSFSLLTINCFGGYLPGTGRRLLALAHELEQHADDVVCFQEVQLQRYFRILQKACRSFPYEAYEPYFHCPKGGLLTLTRTPIQQAQFISYTERGLWYTPMIMDKILHKGMLVTRLEWNKIPLIVINTHILANYVGDWHRHGLYARVEEKQLLQLADTVRAQPSDAIILVAGDFNIPRGSRLYENLLAHSGLEDPLSGDTRPTHRPPLGLAARYALPIDYVLVRKPASHAFQIDCDLYLTDRQWSNGRNRDYLSDHNGIRIRISKD
jgi:endonuclease/exonuclease/phosphatase family metal-dependent hydrolase